MICFFSTGMEVFSKGQNFKFGEIIKVCWKKCFLKKNRYHLCESVFDKVGARKICRWWPVVIFLSVCNVMPEHRGRIFIFRHMFLKKM